MTFANITAPTIISARPINKEVLLVFILGLSSWYITPSSSGIISAHIK